MVLRRLTTRSAWGNANRVDQFRFPLTRLMKTRLTLLSLICAIAAQPLTPAQAAELWRPSHQAAHPRHVSAPPPAIDPAYVAPVARGVSYQSPLDVANQTAAFDPKSVLRASGLRSLLPMLPPQPNSYVSTVNADNPVAFWQLGEASGTTMVDSRNFDSGTYQGGVTLGQPSLVQPASGSSVTFNGSTGYGTAPTLTALQSTNTRSIELWFQTSSQTTQSLFDAGAVAGYNNQMFSLIVTSQGWVTNNPPAGITTPGLYLAMWRQNIYFPDLYLLDGKRHHVVVEVTGNNIWLYVDGTTPGGFFTDSGGNDNYAGSWNYRYLMQQPIALPTALNTGINPILVGSGRYGGSSFNGRMQHVAVYSTALTAAQVQNHWQAGNGLPWGPIIGTATAGQNQVTLSWQAPAFNGTGITGYVVTPKVGTKLRTPITFSTAATTQVISNLSGGTAYTFTVNAIKGPRPRRPSTRPYSRGLGCPKSLGTSKG